MKKKTVGLVGFPLGHSYSPVIWNKLFESEGLSEYSYRLFEIKEVSAVPGLFDAPDLLGINVTIPHKKAIISYLDTLTPEAKSIGAVNTVVKSPQGKLIGHNTDAAAFESSLLRFLDGYSPKTAIVLGTGGSAAAVRYVLSKLQIPHISISRQKKGEAVLSYTELDNTHQLPELIVNTTPLGMYPNIRECPPIDYSKIQPKTYCFDLIYNPERTLFIQKCENKGAFVKNGLEMLHLQARKAWEFICEKSV